MAEIRDRLTIKDILYYNTWNRDPICVSSRKCRKLDTHVKQHYERILEVGSDWELLVIPPDWIKKPGMVVILSLEDNESPNHLHVATPPMERWWMVPPGEMFKGYPSETDCLYVRCLEGVAEFEFHAFPR